MTGNSRPLRRGTRQRRPLKKKAPGGASFAGVLRVRVQLAPIPYLRRNLSTRPPESMIFCLPVKKGWHYEQTSMWSSFLRVDRVVNAFPQLQTTLIS